MSAFGFGFKKKPVGFSKMKESLDPKNGKAKDPANGQPKEDARQEPEEKVAAKKPNPLQPLMDMLASLGKKKQKEESAPPEGETTAPEAETPASGPEEDAPRISSAQKPATAKKPNILQALGSLLPFSEKKKESPASPAGPGDIEPPPEEPAGEGPSEPTPPPRKPAIKKRYQKRLISKRLIILILLLIFIAAVVFGLGPRFSPKLADSIDKISKSKIMEKLKLGKPKEEDLITPEETAIEELVTVRTYRVARGDFVDILPGMGTIRGDREIELRFQVNGIVDSINFFEGDLIRKGDILATLNQKDALLKLEYAKSKMKTQEVAKMAARKKLEMHQQLYDQGIIIEPKLEEVRIEFESVKTQVASAKKEVEFALSELDKTYLYSPTDAVMGTRDVEVGEFVNSNIKVTSLYDVGTVMVEMGIIEKDISRVALGQKVKVNVDAYPGVDFEGKINNVAPIIEGKSRTLTVKVRIKNDNPKGTLLPGMFARIWISVYEKKNTIKVPSSCVYDINNDGVLDSVYIVTGDNIAKIRPVKIGYVSTDYTEITDGLREGEQSVSEAMAELKDNVKVDVIEVQEAAF
ncbi:MAG: efflux RND transporter periplasmic adaptor subunit [Candidatus Omnitrophica bacterium]|nr:efflux RND transporter periplasmic adaptor subunit [Candidatus Omnitrophota bacterium]